MRVGKRPPRSICCFGILGESRGRGKAAWTKGEVVSRDSHLLNGDSLTGRLEFAFELRPGADFDADALASAWKWLEDIVSSRQIYDYESLDDLIADFVAELDKRAASEPDAVEHLEKLPDMQIPELFDHIDDSVFTDQRDPPDAR